MGSISSREESAIIDRVADLEATIGRQTVHIEDLTKKLESLEAQLLTQEARTIPRDERSAAADKHDEW